MTDLRAKHAWRTMLTDDESAEVATLAERAMTLDFEREEVSSKLNRPAALLPASASQIEEGRAMTILALDLGSKLGWAISYGPGDVLHGTIEFKNGRFEGGGMRWLRFRQWLSDMAEHHGPIDAIYFEEVQGLRGSDAARVFGGFLAHLTEWCEKREIPYAGIPVGTIKKNATGKGNANKEAMIAAMRAKGFTPETDNDADALALLLCVLDQRERG